jgi:hypothetical protein
LDTFLFIIASPLFLISIAAHFYVKIRLRPKEGSDLEDYYYEFEDQHPAYANYIKWSRITFIGAVAGALLLFIAAVI